MEWRSETGKKKKAIKRAWAWSHCAVLSCSIMSDSLQPHGLYPTRHHCPWGFSRQEYWSGLPCSPLGDLPNLGVEPKSPALQADSLPSEPPRKPQEVTTGDNVSSVPLVILGNGVEHTPQCHTIQGAKGPRHLFIQPFLSAIAWRLLLGGMNFLVPLAKAELTQVARGSPELSFLTCEVGPACNEIVKAEERWVTPWQHLLSQPFWGNVVILYI